jgi:sulfite reductase alpha subunit-like flavoprotein
MSLGAYVFICGSGAMRDEVRVAFVRIAATEGGMTGPAADAHLTALEKEAYRYRPDVWG